MSTETLWMNIVKFVQNETRDQISKKTGAEAFMEIYNSDTRRELTILKRAMNTGIVTHSLTDNVIQYNGMPLGHTEIEAVQFLKANPTTRTSIDMLSRKTSESSTQLHTVKQAETEESLIIKRQAAELAELKARLANANKPVETLVDEGNKDEDAELVELLIRGKQLDIKGIHMVGKNKSVEERKHLIREKIKEAEEKVTN